jgi:hypothetical protein
LAEALAALFTPIAVTEAIMAIAAATAAVRFPINLLDLKIPPTKHPSLTSLVPLCLLSLL